MLNLRKSLQNVYCSLFVFLGNKYVDDLFWKIVKTSNRSLRDFAARLRSYQIVILNQIERRIDYEVLGNLRERLFPMVRLVECVIDKRGWVFKSARSANMIELDSAENISEPISLSQQTETKLREYPVISIITPSYNQGKFLEKCINSVIAQDYPNIEYIVVDGGSTDNSVEIIRKYESKIKYWVSEKDNGQADAINKGLRFSTGKIFNWLNSDDYLEPGALLKCAQAYEENPSAVGWVGGSRRIDENGDVLTIIYPNAVDRENIGQNWNGRNFYQPSCFLSTKVVKEVGGLDPNLYIALDLDLWVRVLERGRFVIGSGIWSNAIIHPGQKTQQRERVLQEVIDFQKKYGFVKGARIRYNHGFEKGEFRYVMPTFLKERLIKIDTMQKISMNSLPNDPGITFISEEFPNSSREPSELRFLAILEILLGNKCRINYISTSRPNKDGQYFKLRKWGANVFDASVGLSGLETFIGQRKSKYVWISYPSNPNLLTLSLKMTELLKSKREGIKIFVDIPYLINAGYQKTSESITRGKTEYLEKTELLLQIADKIIVSNLMDKKCIEERGVKGTTIEIIPNVYRVLGSCPPYERRRNICYIQNSDSDADVHSLKYFADNIFRTVCRSHNKIEFHIVGRNLERVRKALHLNNTKTIEVGMDIEKLLRNYKLALFPVGYQKYINNGIGIVAGAGVPFVTSSIGAEGFPVRDGEECFISDLPLEFGEKCNQCLDDPIAWHNFRIKSQLMIAENFSPAAIGRKLADLFSGQYNKGLRPRITESHLWFL